MSCVSSHYNDVILSVMASQNSSLPIVYSTVYSGADNRKHQSSASMAFVRGIHRWLVNAPHKGPVARQMFPFDDVIMIIWSIAYTCHCHAACNIVLWYNVYNDIPLYIGFRIYEFSVWPLGYSIVYRAVLKWPSHVGPLERGTLPCRVEFTISQ